MGFFRGKLLQGQALAAAPCQVRSALSVRAMNDDMISWVL